MAPHQNWRCAAISPPRNFTGQPRSRRAGGLEKGHRVPPLPRLVPHFSAGGDRAQRAEGDGGVLDVLQGHDLGHAVPGDAAGIREGLRDGRAVRAAAAVPQHGGLHAAARREVLRLHRGAVHVGAGHGHVPPDRQGRRPQARAPQVRRGQPAAGGAQVGGVAARPRGQEGGPGGDAGPALVHRGGGGGFVTSTPHVSVGGGSALAGGCGHGAVWRWAQVRTSMQMAQSCWFRIVSCV